MEMDVAESAGLRDRHDLLLQERAAAISALSASLFVRPDLHDGFRVTPLFARVKTCNEGLLGLEQNPDAIDKGRPLPP